MAKEEKMDRNHHTNTTMPLHIIQQQTPYTFKHTHTTK